MGKNQKLPTVQTVQTRTNACKYDILCVHETKIVKIRTQNAKKVLIKDQVLKIRTLLETVQLGRLGKEGIM